MSGSSGSSLLARQAKRENAMCEWSRLFFFFQAEDGIRDHCVTGVQTCALPISGIATAPLPRWGSRGSRIGVARPLRFPAHAGYLELRVSRRRLEQRGIGTPPVHLRGLPHAVPVLAREDHFQREESLAREPREVRILRAQQR